MFQLLKNAFVDDNLVDDTVFKIKSNVFSSEFLEHVKRMYNKWPR